MASARPITGRCRPWFRPRPPRPGRAGEAVETAVAGHFGELIQGRLGPSGPLALITLPCPALVARVRLAPGPMALRDPAGLIPRRHAAALLRAGEEEREEDAEREDPARRTARGRATIAADMPPGGGAGSSTAARLALLAAAARSAGREAPSPETAARLCLAQEGATDPLMFAAPAERLWDPREARALAPLPALPGMVVVGGFLGPGRRTDARDLDFADVADLVAAWPEAAGRGDLAALAALAEESARRNQARRGGPDDAPLRAAARAHGALGIAAAHTGSARALIFAPGAGDPAAAARALEAAGLARVGVFAAAAPAPQADASPEAPRIPHAELGNLGHAIPAVPAACASDERASR